MEGNRLPEGSPASPDLSATKSCCCSGLTRSNSGLSSSAVVDLKDASHQDANASPGKFTVWTNEKHKLYLNQLEASFVEELHQRMGLHGWCAKKKNKNSHSSKNQKMNFGTGYPSSMDADSSKSSLGNPWVNYSKYGGKPREKRSFCDGLSASLEQVSLIHPSHEDSISSPIEVSDQNFVDEDREEEKPVRSSMGKRLKARN